MFACGRVGHYAAKCPYRENHEKWMNSAKENFRGKIENKRSFYTHEDSDGLSNGIEGESDQGYQLVRHLKINVLMSLMMFLWII